MSRTASSRTAKPSRTVAASLESWYMPAISCDWRVSNDGLARFASTRLGTCTAPRNVSGNWSVKAMASRAPSTCASRFMNPDWKSRVPVSDWPSSMLSWVSKWLRDVSSVPANGTKASCLRSNSGSMVSASAGFKPHSALSTSAASAALPGRAMAMFGRCS